jgi:hypothetical protein
MEADPYLPNLALARHVVFYDVNEFHYHLIPLEALPISAQSLQTALLTGRARVVVPRLDCVADAMPLIQDLLPDLYQAFIRFLAGKDFHRFHYFFTDTSHVSGFLLVAAIKTATLGCLEQGIASNRHPWNETFVDFCVRHWFMYHGRHSDVNVLSTGFLVQLLDTIAFVNQIVHGHYVDNV